MPCDQIIRNTVDMPQMNGDLLARALAAMQATNVRAYGGIVEFTTTTGRYQLRNGELTGLDGQRTSTVGAQADALKVGYSHQVVKATAARAGWAIKQTAPNTYVVQKR